MFLSKMPGSPEIGATLKPNMFQNGRYIRLFLLLLSALTLGPMAASAQWKIQEDDLVGAGAVQSVIEVRCGPETIVLAGTSLGMFVDPTGYAAPGRWIRANEGLPGNGQVGQIKGIFSLVGRDSIVFAAVEGGIYATVVTSANIPPCRPRAWFPFGNNVAALGTVNDMHLADSSLYAASDDGIWRIDFKPDSLDRFEVTSTSAVWSRVGTNFTNDALSVHKHRNNLVAGYWRNGAEFYDENCEQSGFDCAWFTVGQNIPADELSIHDIVSVSMASLQVETEFNSIPCQGVLLAGAGDPNLFLAPTPLPDSVPQALDFLVDISPVKYDRRMNHRINTVLAGDFPSAPNSIFVGSELGGIWWSGDCGASWQMLNDTEEGTNIDGADISMLTVIRDDLLLASMRTGGLFHGSGFALASLKELMQNVRPTAVNEDTTTVKVAEFDVTADISGERGFAELAVPDENLGKITIEAYNLLGKKVLDIYSGQMTRNRDNFEFSLAALPGGMYLCVVRGRNLKLADKFVVSR